MWPANETESIVVWAKNVHRETREMPEGVRLLSTCREKSNSMIKYPIAVNPASGEIELSKGDAKTFGQEDLHVVTLRKKEWELRQAKLWGEKEKAKQTNLMPSVLVNS